MSELISSNGFYAVSYFTLCLMVAGITQGKKPQRFRLVATCYRYYPRPLRFSSLWLFRPKKERIKKPEEKSSRVILMEQLTRSCTMGKIKRNTLPQDQHTTRPFFLSFILL